MQHLYVTALVDAITSGLDVELALQRTKDILSARGYQKLWPKVLTGALQQLERTAEANKPCVTLAQPDAVAADAIVSHLTKLQLPTEYRLEYDPSLVGGMVIAHNHIVYDSSYKQQLLDLYHAITRTTPAVTK